MSKECFIEKKFSQSSRDIIEKANEIIDEYTKQGYSLTLRQLYYQFVSRALILNKQSEYKKLGSIINDARLAGLVDWNAIEDRTRYIREQSHWKSPSEIIKVCAEQYHVNRWSKQKYQPYVWIEKDALIGVIEDVCDELDVPYFSCRGYVSQSEMWRAARRFMSDCAHNKQSVLLHLGDHDPSGIDMSRDIRDRIRMFFGGEGVIFKRLALNYSQIEQYNPPPNPAKETDSRSNNYIEKYGASSWELDALEPSVISTLIRDEVNRYIDTNILKKVVQYEKSGMRKLKKISDGLEKE